MSAEEFEYHQNKNDLDRYDFADAFAKQEVEPYKQLLSEISRAWQCDILNEMDFRKLIQEAEQLLKQ